MKRRTGKLFRLVFLCVGIWILVGLNLSSVSAQTTVKAWLETGPLTSYYPEAIQIFEKENPNIKIDWFALPWSGHVEKYTTAIATDTLPDIGITYTGLFATWLFPKNLLLPLDNFMGKEGVTAENIRGIDAYGYRYKGQVYALPQFLSVEANAQNADMFNKAGVPLLPMDRPATWDEYTEASSKLTRDFDGDGKPDQYASAYPGVPDPSTGDMLFTIFMTAGVNVIENNKFGLNNPVGIEALKWLMNFDEKYSPTGTVGMERPEVRALFNEQITAITRQVGAQQFFSEWPQNYPDLNVMPAMPPRWNKAEGTDYGSASAYVIFESSENPQLAWRWLQYFFSEDNMIFLSSEIGKPATRSDVGAKYITVETDVAKRAMAVLERQAPFAKGEPAHPAYLEVYEIALSEIQAARLGVKSAEKALTDAEKRVNEVLKQYVGI